MCGVAVGTSKPFDTIPGDPCFREVVIRLGRLSDRCAMPVEIVRSPALVCAKDKTAGHCNIKTVHVRTLSRMACQSAVSEQSSCSEYACIGKHEIG